MPTVLIDTSPLRDFYNTSVVPVIGSMAMVVEEESLMMSEMLAAMGEGLDPKCLTLTGFLNQSMYPTDVKDGLVYEAKELITLMLIQGTHDFPDFAQFKATPKMGWMMELHTPVKPIYPDGMSNV